MKFITLALFVPFALFASKLDAQHGNFSWSPFDLQQSAVFGDLDLVVQKGTSTTLFLYFDTFGVHNITEGFEIDFSWTNPDVAHFTAAETFDYDVLVQGNPFSLRYGDFAGPATTVTDNNVEGFMAINVVNGTGLLASQDGSDIFLDSGYDFSSEAFQIGIISFDAVANGTTQLQIDDALIVDNGMDNDSAFSSLTITVVPEPGTVSVLLVAVVGLLTRRNSRSV